MIIFRQNYERPSKHELTLRFLSCDTIIARLEEYLQGSGNGHALKIRPRSIEYVSPREPE